MAIPVSVIKWAGKIGRAIQVGAPKALGKMKWFKGVFGEGAELVGAAGKTVGYGRAVAARAKNINAIRFAKASEHGYLESSKFLLKRRMEIIGGAGIVGGIGATIAAIDQNPDTDPLTEGLKGAVGGSMWQVFGPTANMVDHGMIQGMMGGGISRMGITLPSKRDRIAGGMSGYTGETGIDQYSGNLRRQALGHMMQSRQNTRSFIGSEARSMHDSGGY